MVSRQRKRGRKTLTFFELIQEDDLVAQIHESDIIEFSVYFYHDLWGNLLFYLFALGTEAGNWR